MSSFHEQLMEMVSFSPLSMQPPNSWCGHLPFAAWLVGQFRPRLFVELGTHYGNSYFTFCQSVVKAQTDTQCFAVDTWQGDEHAGSYGDEVFDYVNAHNQQHYSSFSQLLRMEFDAAVELFADGSIDLLHIDGMHTYEAVKHDFQTWLPKLASGAIVLFHDTTVRDRGFGVWKLWREIQSCYPDNLEFSHSHGLGVVRIGGEIESQKQKWLCPDFLYRHILIEFFSQIGQVQIDRFELSQLRKEFLRYQKCLLKKNQHLEKIHLDFQKIDHELHQRNIEYQKIDQELHQRNTEYQKIDQELNQRNLEYQKIYQELQNIKNSRAWKLLNRLQKFSSF